MRFLDDQAVARLAEISDLPDLSATKYRLVRRLARGGMGTVYLVEDRELGREVALKVLSEPDPSTELSDRLLREAQHLARLEHPNIVPVHDVGRLPDGRVFYAMKFIRGKRLDHWRAEGPSRPALLRMFQKICEAVAFAHARGVIHRDLKPENVMVGSFGEAVVMDWGVAKALRREPEPETGAGPPSSGEDGGSRRATAHGMVMGTPAYMAPEQARGEVDRLDERTDVYALGALLYSLLAGRAPSDTVVDTREPGRNAWAAPAPLRRLDPGIPRVLESICGLAMAERPEDRYATALEMAEDVDRYLDGRPALAHREGLLEKGARFFGKYQFLVLLILAYLVLRLVVLLLERR